MANEKLPSVCGRCGLELPPGAYHPTADECVNALKYVLEVSTKCQSCGVPVPPYCPQHLVRAAGQNAVHKAASGLADRLLNGIFGDPGEASDERPRTKKEWRP